MTSLITLARGSSGQRINRASAHRSEEAGLRDLSPNQTLKRLLGVGREGIAGAVPAGLKSDV